MNNRLIPDLWNLIANKYLNPETVFRMQMLYHGFFAQNISEETLALHQMIAYYPDLLKNYRCPSERKNWKDTQALVLAQYCDANNDKERLNLLLAARTGSVTKLKAAKLTLDHIFNIKDHNGNDLVSLAKTKTQQDDTSSPMLNYFYSIALSELESKGSEQEQALALLKDEKYHPAFYWQPTVTAEMFLWPLVKKMSNEKQKKEFVDKTLSTAILHGRAHFVDRTLKSLIFANIYSNNRTNHLFYTTDDIKKYVTLAVDHKQCKILKIIFNDDGCLESLSYSFNFLLWILCQLSNDDIKCIQKDILNAFNACHGVSHYVNKVGNRNWTNLHFAANSKQTWFVHYLIDKGANPFIKNDNNKKPSELTMCIKTKALLLLAEFLYTKTKQEKIFFLEKELTEWALSEKQDIEIKRLLEKCPALKNVPGLKELVQLAEENEQSFLFKNMPICLDVLQSFIDTAAVYLSSYKFTTPKYNLFKRYGACLYVGYRTEDRNSFFYYSLKEFPNFITFISNVICDFGLAYLKEKYFIHKMIAPNGGGYSYIENDFMGHKGILHDFLIMDMKEGNISMDWDKYREVLAKINPKFQNANESLLLLADELRGKIKLPFSFNGYEHKLVEEKQHMNKPEMR